MNWKNYENEVYEFLPDTAKEIIQEKPEEAVFCRDGIIDETVFGKAQLNGESFRPLYILREVHDEGGCSLCKEPLKECKSHGINKTTGLHWIDFSKCIHGYKEKKSTTKRLLKIAEFLEEYLGVEPNSVDDILNRIAIINLKKIGGGSSAETEKSVSTYHFSCHAQKFKNELKAQIEEIQPSIIICGGTYEEVYKILDNLEEIDSRNASCKVYKTCLLEKDIYVLSMYHPDQRRLSDEVIKEHLCSGCEIVKSKLQ